MGLYWFYFDRTQERLAKVQAAAERAVQLRTGLPEAHVAKAYYYYHGHLDYEHALAELELARRGRPNDAEILSVLAFVVRRQGKWEEAYTALARVIELDPRSARGYFEASTTAAVLRRYHQAEQWLLQSIAIYPEEPRSYVGLAALAMASKGDRRAAGEALARGIKAAGPIPMFRVSGGLAAWDLLVQVLPDSAISQLREVSLGESNLDTAIIYQWRAELARRDGQAADQRRLWLDSALTRYLQLLKDRPEDATYRMRVANIYMAQKRKADALREGEAAAALLPVSKDALDGGSLAYSLARLYATGGQGDSAVARLERLMAGPHFPPITAAWLRADPLWDPLRSNPRFQKLLAGQSN
jgi:predicted Zn-dependent protease